MAIPIIGKIIDTVVDKGAGLISEFITDKDEANRLLHEMQKLKSEQDHERQVLEAETSKELELEFSKRVTQMEGTAKDLQQFGILGKIVVFFRGMFRPLFSYGVAYWDWLYFTSGAQWTEQQQTLLLTVNLIVLVFYFGERAIKNLAPLLTRMFTK